MGALARVHGKHGLIYVSGSEMTNASAMTITETTDSEEGPEFGDTFPLRAIGLSHWSGTVTSWYYHGVEILFGAAIAGFPVAVLAYPNREQQTIFYAGNAIFSFEISQEVTGLVGQTASFVGSGGLALNP